MRCDKCDTVIERAEPFSFKGTDLCCECMSALCSWFLDGGCVDDPDQFAWVLADDLTFALMALSR